MIAAPISIEYNWHQFPRTSGLKVQLTIPRPSHSASPGRGGRARSLYAITRRVGGHGAKGAPFFWCMLLHQTISAFEHHINKKGHYTNVVCCEMKILHSEQHPSLSVVPNSFRGEHWYCILSFAFLSLFPTLWRGPLSWGYGLPRFGP